MNDHLYIRYLTHSEIDKNKWDSCIESSTNGLIYAFSWYLDVMSKNWDALVLNDYEAVMPLTWNKKYGIQYLYQPFLTAQSGVFGNIVTSETLDVFLKAVPKKFQFWDFCLNRGNLFSLKDFSLFQRSNFILNLDKSYPELYIAYNENIRRNLKKAEQAGCLIQKNFPVEKVIELASEQMKQFAHNYKDGLERFKRLYPVLEQKGMADSYGVFIKEKLLASCIILNSHQRIYYVLVGNHPDGKNIGASPAVIDAVIKDHAGKKITLDFEGSDIPGLANFYSSFGSKEEKYTAIRLNRLPFFLKWLKR
ncbi:MAG: GNAT family N-acetyltransferase [Bacteroidetes bacterium]|nr:GNAT family N-acetyltransferase [Bacteroidota bacterium]MBS1930419.1 GNAT family N-acetyltransferase [Bacteroidota bacterium]